MDENDVKELYPLVLDYALHLPVELRELFIPGTNSEIRMLEQSLAKLKKREEERGQVITLQFKYGLPFRPNMSLRETIIKCKIEEMRKKRGGPRR